MNLLPRLFISWCAVVLLCQCSSSDSGKKNPADMTLAQRSTAKPSETQRSQFEKYIGGKGLQTGAGAWYQRQAHHAKGYSGASSYAAQKQFKTSQSSFGKKATGMDMTYSLGDKQSSLGKGTFKTEGSKFGSQAAREGGSAFNSGNDMFKTGSALPRSKGMPRAPLIIENIEATSAKNSAYTEDEVKKLLGR